MVADARRDPARAVLEGVHVWKHAVRFGAAITHAVTTDLDELAELVGTLAPDLTPPEAMVVDLDTWQRLAPNAPTSPLLCVAHRPPDRVDDVASRPTTTPVVVLERPTHLGNIGAVVRVAAAANVAAVIVVGGTADPWHATALRGGAGLQFAVPTARRDRTPTTTRTVVAVHPDGDTTAAVPPGAMLVFGTERHGLTDEALARADAVLALPMRVGVSSLNLATTVSAVLYRR